MDPTPLKQAVVIPSEIKKEEQQALVIEVQVETGEDGGYDVESANMKFAITATKVLLGEGELQQELPSFKPITCDFDMNQHKINHSRF